MNDTAKVYVLRTTIFGYDDEYWHVDHEGGGPIAGIFTDREAAMVAWRRLEAEKLTQRSLDSEPRFFERSDEEKTKIDALIFARTGEHIAEEYGQGDRRRVDIYQESLQGLSNEDLFLVLEATNCLAYVMTEFNVESTFYVRWLNREQRYQAFERDHYGFGEGPTLCFSTNPQELAEWVRDEREWEEGEPVVLDGTLADLSGTPEVLKSLIDLHPSVQYDESAQRLTIDRLNGPALSAVNAVLKSPLFEIREVTREDLFQIQQNVLGEPASS